MRFLMCSGARVKVGADQVEAQEPPERQSPRWQSQIGLAPAPVLGRIARRGAVGRSAGAGAAAPTGFLPLRSRPARASNGSGNGRWAALRVWAAARIQRTGAAVGRRGAHGGGQAQLAVTERPRALRRPSLRRWLGAVYHGQLCSTARAGAGVSSAGWLGAGRALAGARPRPLSAVSTGSRCAMLLLDPENMRRCVQLVV